MAERLRDDRRPTGRRCVRRTDATNLSGSRARRTAKGPAPRRADESGRLHSERLIQGSLLTLKGEVTLFIIAHRISTLDMCNRVMVILDGKLNAFDAFTRVREDNAYYRSVTAAT